MKMFAIPVLLSTMASVTFAASFDCSKASHPLESAICGNPELSRADEEMAASYQFLVTQCQARTGSGALRAEQKAWLTSLRSDYRNAGNPRWLAEKYSERNSALALQLAQCGTASFLAEPVIVKSLHYEKLGYTLPFVETRRPGVARRINDWIFKHLLDQPAPATMSIGRSWFAREIPSDGPRSLMSADFSVIRNDGRVLVINLAIEACGAYCSASSDQYFFDTRDGRQVAPEDLFGDREAGALARRLKAKRIKRGKAILARTRFEPDERETYERCLGEWARWEPELWPIRIDADGSMRFVAGSCSAHVNRPQDALDNLDEVMSMSELKPHFNGYARSLLLGEGDVRDPVANIATANCKGRISPILSTEPRTAKGIASISAGSSSADFFHLLLQDDGRLWSWGHNFDGELGYRSFSGLSQIPALVGDDFVQASAGQSFAAGIRRDGTLWTWGSNYAGRLGNGDKKNQSGPVRIGDKFAAVTLNSGTGLALRTDGTLWTWGGEPIAKDNSDQFGYRLTPRQLTTDVKQMEYGPRGQILALKKDGSLWAWGDGDAAPPPKPGNLQRIEGNFLRLAGRNLDAAYKADGSLWAWGSSLNAMAYNSERIDQAPALVGRDFVNVKTAEDNFVIALKADGGLWATHQRGRITRLEPVGCGFVDIAALRGPTVFALKQDGSLHAWGNWKRSANWNAQKDMFAEPPLVLGKHFTRLYQVGALWGSLGAHAIVLKDDGSVWQWQYPEQPPARDLLQQVPFANGGILPR